MGLRGTRFDRSGWDFEVLPGRHGRGSGAGRRGTARGGRRVRRGPRPFGEREDDAAQHHRRAGHTHIGQRVCRSGRDITAASRSELFALRRETVSFIFQSFNLFPGLTALENVEFGVDVAGKRGSVSPDSVLESVGLGHRTDHFPHELSGGGAAARRHCQGLGHRQPRTAGRRADGRARLQDRRADTGTPDRAGLRRPRGAGSHPQPGDIAHRRQGCRDEQWAHHQRRPACGRQDTTLGTALVEVAECWH